MLRNRRSFPFLLSCAAVAGFIGLLGLKAGAQSVVDPTDAVAGKSQYEWTADWWTTAGQASAAGNPLFSASGSESLALINQAGSPVYFLTGSVDGGAVDRTAAIAADQYIFFPVFSYLEWKSFGDPDVGDNTCNSANAAMDPGVIDDVFATLNGSPIVADIVSYRQSCKGQPDISPANEPAIDGAFQSSRPAGSLFEAFGTENPDTFASDGYWLMLEPLPVGTYELSFGGSLYEGAAVQNNKYRLLVNSVPGPMPLLGVAAAFRCSRMLRKRVKRGNRPGRRAIG
jgi:hypothetical protein